MIGAWMLYALIVSALLAAAALCVERLAGAFGQPRRTAWLAAMCLSVAWPLLAILTHSWRSGATTGRAMGVLHRAAPIVTTATAFISRVPRLDALLLAAWCIASLLLTMRLALSAAWLRRQRRAWEAHVLDGTAVRVSGDAGPAVIGLAPMEIVVPRWTLELDAPLRALMLRHEAEHRAARDPLVLLIAAAIVCLMPWNAPLWWCTRRLRLALELDCDAKVLAAHPDTRRYGLLVLTVAQRHTLAPGRLAPMLSEPRTDLQRRIDAMLNRSRRNRLTLAAAVCGALITLALACSVESPDSPKSAAANTASQSNAPGIYSYGAPQVDKFASIVPGSAAPKYPAELRAASVEGEVVAQWVVNTDGRADIATFKVLKTTDQRFSDAVHTWLGTARFTPARVKGAAVNQLVQLPFDFALNK